MFSGLDFFVASSFFDDLLDFLFGVLTGFWWFCYGDFCFVSLISCPDVCFMFCLDSSFVFHHFPITLPVYSLLIGIVVVLCSEALGRWWLFCGFCVSSLILGLFWLGGLGAFFQIIRFSSFLATISAPTGVRLMLLMFCLVWVVWFCTVRFQLVGGCFRCLQKVFCGIPIKDVNGSCIQCIRLRLAFCRWWCAWLFPVVDVFHYSHSVGII